MILSFEAFSRLLQLMDVNLTAFSISFTHRYRIFYPIFFVLFDFYFLHEMKLNAGVLTNISIILTVIALYT